MLKWELTAEQHERCDAYIDETIGPTEPAPDFTTFVLWGLVCGGTEALDSDVATWVTHLAMTPPWLVMRAAKQVNSRLVPPWVEQALVATFGDTCRMLLQRGYPPPGVLGSPPNHPFRVLTRKLGHRLQASGFQQVAGLALGLSFFGQE